MLNIALNPARVSVAGIFSAATIQPFFAPALASAPGTLILALNPAPSGANFIIPTFVAIDGAGNAWVTNQNSNSVTKLASSGALAGNFNNTNTPGAHFAGPVGVAIDSGGNAWLANQGSNSVTKLSSSGALVGNFNNTNTPGANFAFTLVVAIDAAGNAWVTNNSLANLPNSSVTKLTSTGALVDNFDNTNTPGADFAGPFDVAIDAAGNVWVTNQFTGNLVAGSVTKLTTSGGLIGNFNNTNTTGSNFFAPIGTAIDIAGDAWIANGNGSSVTKLTSSGALVGNFNNTNTPGAGFSGPDDVAIDAVGNAWVVNGGNSLTELTSSGALVGNFSNNTPGPNFDHPFGVAIDSAGNVWVANENDNTVTELVGAARPVRTPKVACLKLATPHAVCLP
jgi:streptogramin lyase